MTSNAQEDGESGMTEEVGSGVDTQEMLNRLSPQISSSRCSGFCLPFVIYVVLAAANMVILAANKSVTGAAKTQSLVLGFTWVFVWGLIIFMLCRHCKRGWAWFVFFLPLILSVITFLLFGAFALYIERKAAAQQSASIPRKRKRS